MRSLIFSLLTVMMCVGNASAVTYVKKYALSRFGDAKYEKIEKPFPYVNGSAPKGGTLKLSTVGTFDTLNVFVAKGTAPMEAVNATFDRLMYRAPDEPFTLYPLIAEYVELATDNSSIIVHIHPKATFQDGTPVTSADIIATQEHLSQKGRPIFKGLFKKVKTFKAIDEKTLQVDFHPRDDGSFDPEAPLVLAISRVIPKSFLESHDLGSTGLKPIPTTGPYRVLKFEIGHFIELERVKNYWAKDLPIRKGFGNFDKIRVDYYKNQNAQFQAFQSGAFDAYFETNPSQWNTNYNFKAVKSGKVEKFEAEHKKPVLIRSIIFNMRRPIFSNIHLRKALVDVFDFKTMNRMIYAGGQKSPKSLFENTYLAHTGAASKEEKNILLRVKEFAKDIYQNLISKAFTMNDEAPNKKRLQLQETLKNLKDNGYVLKKGALHGRDGKPIVLEIMVKDEKAEKVALFYKENLKKIGVVLKISRMDTVQYENRVMESDFDMIVHAFANSLSPGAEQTYYFGSEYAHKKGSSNYMGISDKGTDFLVDNLCKANTKEEHTCAARALDRYIMHQYWQIPLVYDNVYRVAYWKDRFNVPKFNPETGTNLMSWGWSLAAEKQSSLMQKKN